MVEQRIVVIGDELVAGTGDPKRLGWVGRAMTQTPIDDTQHLLTLARVGDTTKDLASRFGTEIYPRFGRRCDNRLVVGVGVGDVRGNAVSSARSRLHLANLLDEADRAGATSFVVGPPPLPGLDPAALARFSRACSEVCQRRRIPYVDTFTPLLDLDQWLTDLGASETGLPGQAGYGLLAWLVLHRGWVSWLVGDDPQA